MYSVPCYEPIASSQHGSDQSDSIFSWEREERARNAIESGYSDNPRKGARYCRQSAGKGSHSKMLAAIWGSDESRICEGVQCNEESPRLYNKRPAATYSSERQFLTGKQFVELYSAVAYANHLGIVMNVHVSITWKLLGIHSHQEAAKALRYEFFKHLQEWCEYRMPAGHRFVWIYVHEVGRRHGFHTHLLTAIPNELRQEFREWMANRMAKLSRTGSAPKEAYGITAPPSDRIGRQWRYFQYLCKGIGCGEEVASAVGTEPSVQAASLIRVPGGRPADVRCRKRCGVSNNIGAQARKNDQHESLLERGVTDVRQLYAGMEYLAYLRNHPSAPGTDVMPRLLENEARAREISVEDAANALADEEKREQRKTDLDYQRKVARRLERQHDEQMARLVALFQC